MEGGELFNRIQERKSFNERGKKTIIGIVIVEVIDVTIDVNLVVVVIVFWSVRLSLKHPFHHRGPTPYLCNHCQHD